MRDALFQTDRKLKHDHEELLHMLRFQATHEKFLRKRSMRFVAIDRRNARQFKFDKNGEMISVAQHFLQEYEIELEHADWPVALNSRNNAFPIELFQVAPDLPVPKADASTLKESSFSPREFFSKAIAALDLCGLMHAGDDLSLIHI